MKRTFRGKYIIICLVLILCGMFQMNMIAKADKVIDAKPENSTEAETSDDTINATPDKEEPADQESAEKNGWNKDKTCYYKNGKKVKGIQKIKGKLYYFSSKGNLYKKKGLQKIGEKTYYFNRSHTLKTGVVKTKGKYYYFSKKNGARYEKSGIRKVDGKYYNFSSKYTLKSGWYRDKKNKRYYFSKKTYQALTGWNYVGKYKYYFNSKGQLSQDVRKKLSKTQKKSYVIRVNRTASCVTIYAKDGRRGYTIPVVSFVCSAGNGTPTGTFKIKDKLRWHELMGPCWGQWCQHITPDILFHSVYYDRRNDNKSLNVAAYNKLGTMASHGCIRLTAGDCKWIYDNCKVGTKVIIYNKASDPGPFDKPKARKLSPSHTWDPTDPAFK